MELVIPIVNKLRSSSRKVILVTDEVSTTAKGMCVVSARPVSAYEPKKEETRHKQQKL